jgi:hypothetical protein
MARAGFTAISSGKITFGKDGRWYSDDEPIPNAAINRLFSRTLKILPDGRARLELGEDKADVVIEDTPWVVTGVEGNPTGGFVLVLNDETREPLDPTGLRVGPGNVLYARVKAGAHEARVLRPRVLRAHAARRGGSGRRGRARGRRAARDDPLSDGRRPRRAGDSAEHGLDRPALRRDRIAPPSRRPARLHDRRSTAPPRRPRLLEAR